MKLSVNQLTMLRGMRIMRRTMLRSIYKVTEWKDGCVYRTKFVGYILCGPDYKLMENKDFMICSVSTNITKELIS